MEQSETEIITRSVFIATLHEELDKFRKEFLGNFRELHDEIKETRNRAEARSDALSDEIKEANRRTDARFDAQSKDINELKEILNKLPGMVWRTVATIAGILSALIGVLFLLFGG